MTTPGGTPASDTQVDEPRCNDRRVARRLQDHGIAAHDGGGGHPDHDRAGEVPWRNHRADAERNIDELVSLAGNRDDRLRLRVAQRFARIKLDKVDRFGDVTVGLGPAFPDFVDQQRVVVEPALAQQRPDFEKIRGAIGERQMPPRIERTRRRLDRLSRLLLRCGAGYADDLIGIGRVHRPDLFLSLDFAPTDDERIVFAEFARDQGKRILHRCSIGRIAKVFHSFVLKGRHVQAGLRRCRRHGAIVPAPGRSPSAVHGRRLRNASGRRLL